MIGEVRGDVERPNGEWFSRPPVLKGPVQRLTRYGGGEADQLLSRLTTVDRPMFRRLVQQAIMILMG